MIDDTHLLRPEELVEQAYERFAGLARKVKTVQPGRFPFLDKLSQGYEDGTQFLKRAKGLVNPSKSLLGRILGSDKEALYEALHVRDTQLEESIAGVYRQAGICLERNNIQNTLALYGKVDDDQTIADQHQILFDLETALTTVQLLQIRTQNLEPSSTWSDSLVSDPYFKERFYIREGFYRSTAHTFEESVHLVYDLLTEINNNVGIAILQLRKESPASFLKLNEVLAKPLGLALEYFEEATNQFGKISKQREQKAATGRIDKVRMEVFDSLGQLHPQDPTCLFIVYEGLTKLRRENFSESISYLSQAMDQGLTPSQHDKYMVGPVNHLTSLLDTFKKWGIIPSE